MRKTQSSVENKFIGVTAILVVMLAFPTVNTILTPPSPSFEEQLLSEIADSKSSEVQGRGPASVPDVQSDYVEASAPSSFLKPVVLEWNCLQAESEDIEASGTHLRLRGQGCDGQSVQIENMTNGFTASVFREGNLKFSTDFIDLVKGENKLRISFQNNNRSPQVREIIVRRLL